MALREVAPGIEVDVVFTVEKHMVRERTIEHGSPALVRLADVQRIVQKLVAERDAVVESLKASNEALRTLMGTTQTLMDVHQGTEQALLNWSENLK